MLVSKDRNGIAPPLPERKAEVKPTPAGVASEKEEADWRQIKPSQVRPPSSSEEAVKMLVLAERMLELGLETCGASATDLNIAKISTGMALTRLL